MKQKRYSSGSQNFLSMIQILKFHWPCDPNSTTTYSGPDLKTLMSHDCTVHYPSEGSGCAMYIYIFGMYGISTQ